MTSIMLPRETPTVGDPRRTSPEPSAIELRGRINLALSLLHHRAASEENWELVRRALNGASVAELAEAER